MPSVRHFGGPGLLVGAVLSSKLAKRLEVLEFYKSPIEGLGTLSELLPVLDSVSELLRLNRLKIRMDRCQIYGWNDILDILSKLTPRMSVLEELALWLVGGPTGNDEDGQVHLNRFLNVLGQMPHFSRQFIYMPRYSDGKLTNDANNLYGRIKASYPLLDIMDDLNHIFS
ncbi:hypothetical protein B0J17DRAFT_718309 [Rhizoctonia solani]|nr:hypothetical protein B0J17DRAFT_718309 [Rhizoctonia solani]